MADIAHELRTPLSILQANVEAMQDGILETSAENLASLHQETLLPARLIEDLRTLSQAESGQLFPAGKSLDDADEFIHVVVTVLIAAQGVTDTAPYVVP